MGQEPLPLIRPMLAVNSLPFDSDLHLFEIKWDGYRVSILTGTQP